MLLMVFFSFLFTTLAVVLHINLLESNHQTHVWLVLIFNIKQLPTRGIFECFSSNGLNYQKQNFFIIIII